MSFFIPSGPKIPPSGNFSSITSTTINVVETQSVFGTVSATTLTDGTFSTTGGVVTGANMTSSTNNIAANSLQIPDGVVNINSTAPTESGQTLITTGLNTATWQTISGESAAGANTEIQYNNNGDFGADSNLTWNSGAQILTIGDANDNKLQLDVNLLGTSAINPSLQGSALSYNQSILLTGGPHDNSNIGAVWVFENTQYGWIEITKLVPSDNIGESLFGGSENSSIVGNQIDLYIDGGIQTAIIGGLGDNSNIGAAWIFQDTGGGWEQVTKLTPSGNVGPPNFGTSVSIVESSGTYTAAIGGSEDNGAIGAVWIFQYSGSDWTQVTKIVPNDEVTNAFFGISSSMVIISDLYTLAVGGWQANYAVGAVWIYQSTGGTSWTKITKIVPPNVIGSTAYFGVSTSLIYSAGTYTLIAGGSVDNTNLGAAWIYESTDGTTWTEVIKLVPTDYVGSTIFYGVSVAIENYEGVYYAAVGGNGDNDNIGTVWFYQNTGDGWTFVSHESPVFGYSYFGYAVSMYQGNLIVGSPFYRNNSGIGASFVYNLVKYAVTVENGNVDAEGTITASTFTDGKGIVINSGTFSDSQGTTIGGGTIDTNSINLIVPLSPTIGGTGINNGDNTLTLSGGTLRFDMSDNTNLTLPTSGTLITSAQLPSYPVTAADGGTGVNNGSNTFTITGGTLVIELGENTNVAFPNTGTVATTSQLPTFPISAANGGTGVDNSDTLTLSGGNLVLTMSGNTGVTLPTSGTLVTTSQIIPTIGSSTNSGIVTWNGTGGNALNSTPTTVDGSGNMIVNGNLSVTGLGTGYTCGISAYFANNSAYSTPTTNFALYVGQNFTWGSSYPTISGSYFLTINTSGIYLLSFNLTLFSVSNTSQTYQLAINVPGLLCETYLGNCNSGTFSGSVSMIAILDSSTNIYATVQSTSNFTFSIGSSTSEIYITRINN